MDAGCRPAGPKFHTFTNNEQLIKQPSPLPYVPLKHTTTNTHNSRIITVMASPDNLRTKFQESAALFLTASACVKKVMKKGKGNILSSHSNSKNSFDPMLTARSLILRSMYMVPVSANVDDKSPGNDTKCIIPSITCQKIKSETVNLIRSGGNVVSVPAETAEDITHKSLLGFNEMGNDVLQISSFIAHKMFSTSSSTFDAHRNTVRHDFFCKCCGGSLLPLTIDGGMSSTIRVRSLKRSRTRRRRASRNTAKKHVFDENILQKNKGGGRTFSQGTSSGSTVSSSHGSSVMAVMDTKVALKTSSAARRTRDGISKNCVRFKCGCGQVQSMKGLKRRRGNGLDGGTGTRRKSEESDTVHNSTSTHTTHSESTASSNIGGEDFVSLRAYGQSAAASQTNLKPLLQQQGRKRKAPRAKPKKPGKKSGLQNFLSSLND